MADEQEVRSLKGGRRKVRQLLDEWLLQSRNTAKPFCMTCAKMDESNGALKNYEDYTKDIKLVSKSEAQLKEFSPKDPSVLYMVCD